MSLAVGIVAVCLSLAAGVLVHGIFTSTGRASVKAVIRLSAFALAVIAATVSTKLDRGAHEELIDNWTLLTVPIFVGVAGAAIRGRLKRA